MYNHLYTCKKTFSGLIQCETVKEKPPQSHSATFFFFKKLVYRLGILHAQHKEYNTPD